ncbi:hypothetical protein As57867_007227, partial [Aphanomyces stellatus]
MAPKPRRRYTDQELHDSIKDVISGKSLDDVSAATKIPRQTLQRETRLVRLGIVKEPKRPGPKPILPSNAEADLVSWIAAMQRDGHPVNQYEIMRTANRMVQALDPNASLTSGWYYRFLGRNPVLSQRMAQTISRARNEVDDESVERLYNSMKELMAKYQFLPDRIFNMDETAFNSRKKSHNVVVIKGSPNVWAKTISTNFHLSIVACGSASGILLPPLFLLPGETVDKTLSACSIIDGATISTSPKGFMNEDLFCEWLRWFARLVDSCNDNPVLLVFDGLASHYSPTNATHLFQPFDICVFRPFKDAIRKAIFQAMVEH